MGEIDVTVIALVSVVVNAGGTSPSYTNMNWFALGLDKLLKELISAQDLRSIGCGGPELRIYDLVAWPRDSVDEKVPFKTKKQ